MKPNNGGLALRTKRQQEILRLASKGLRNAEIAAQIGLSERTVKMYFTQLFEMFDVTNRTELVVVWIEGAGASENGNAAVGE